MASMYLKRGGVAVQRTLHTSSVGKVWKLRMNVNLQFMGMYKNAKIE